MSYSKHQARVASNQIKDTLNMNCILTLLLATKYWDLSQNLFCKTVNKALMNNGMYCMYCFHVLINTNAIWDDVPCLLNDSPTFRWHRHQQTQFTLKFYFKKLSGCSTIYSLLCVYHEKSLLRITNILHSFWVPVRKGWRHFQVLLSKCLRISNMS